MENACEVHVTRYVRETVPNKFYTGELSIGGLMFKFQLIFEIEIDALEKIKNTADFRTRIIITIKKNEREIVMTDAEYFCFYQILVPFIVDNQKHLSNLLLLEENKGWLKDSVVFTIPRQFWDLLISTKYS